MQDLREVKIDELDELEEMVCLDLGGTVSCCCGGDASTEVDGITGAATITARTDAMVVEP